MVGSCWTNCSENWAICLFGACRSFQTFRCVISRSEGLEQWWQLKAHAIPGRCFGRASVYRTTKMARNDMLVSHELKVNARPRWCIWWRQQWTKGKSHGKWIPFDDPAIFCEWILWKIMIKTSESKNGLHKLQFPHIDVLRRTITKKHTSPQDVHKVKS